MKDNVISIPLPSGEQPTEEPRNERIFAYIDRNNLIIVGIPERNTLTYVFRKTRNGGYDYYILHRPTDKSESFFRLHVGRIFDLKEAHVVDVEKMKDGTRWIIYNHPYDGKLYDLFIPPQPKNRPATEQLNGNEGSSKDLQALWPERPIFKT
jgi:hypothetical protein